jgi:hypothetical protein
MSIKCKPCCSRCTVLHCLALSYTVLHCLLHCLTLSLALSYTVSCTGKVARLHMATISNDIMCACRFLS